MLQILSRRSFWWCHRSTWAVALTVAMTPAIGSSESPVQVRVIEIGESRPSTIWKVHVPSRYLGPVAVQIETRASDDYVGVLETVLRTTNDPLWQPVNVNDAGRVDIQLNLKAGERSIIEVLYKPERVLGKFVGIDWRVRGADGSTIDRGRQETRREDDLRSGPTWELLLTTTAGPGCRRSPSRAYRAAFQYGPYRAVVIDSANLAVLDTEQLEALLDAISFGRSLVVCGGTAGLPNQLADALSQENAIVWQGDDGFELRETSLVFGTVRSFSAGLEELLGSSEPVRKLIGFDGLLMPSQVYYSSFPAEMWPNVFPEEESSGKTPKVVWLCLLIAMIEVIVLAGLAVYSRRNPPFPGAALASLLIVVAALPFVAYRALASNPVGGFSDESTVIWHDIRGTAQVRCVYKERGGGGGAVPVELRYRRSRRGIWYQISSGTRWRTIVEGPEWERNESIGVETAARQSMAVLGLYGEPADSAWIGSATWDGQGFVGRIQATRDYEMVVLIGFSGSASLGEVRKGQWIDLQDVDFGRGVGNLSPEEIELTAYNWRTSNKIHQYSRPVFPSTHREFRLTVSEILLVARQSEPPNVIHVQPIEIQFLAFSPPFLITEWVPSEDLGASYRLFIPERLFSSLGEGTKVRTYTSISFEVREDLQSTRRNGFRVLEVKKSFRSRGDADHEYIGLMWRGGVFSE